jgi:hypothetical protein
MQASLSSDNENDTKMARQRSSASTDNEVVAMSTDLEMDELNDHECMVSMVTLLRTMVAKQITPPVAEVIDLPIEAVVK